MNNKVRITLVSFLAYFVMSGLLAPIGIVSGPLAQTLGLSITEVTAGFSWLTFGILGGAVAALFVLNWINLKLLLLVLFALIAAGLSILRIVPQAEFIWYAFGLAGVCAGISLAAAALTISRTYTADQRASMLVITDSWFSVAGVVCSWIAIYLLARNFHWSGSYLFIAFITSGLFILVLTSKFPDTLPPAPTEQSKLRWPRGVWLCVTALFLYTLGQNSMLWWLPNYVETELGVSADRAGSLVGQFWLGMFAAQLFVAWWVLKVGVSRVILTGGITAIVFSIPLWIVRDIDTLFILAAIWGFANLGLLKMVLSHATYLLPQPTPRLISCLLLGASLGTAVSPWVTSRIVAATSNHFILQFSTLCYLCLTLLMVITIMGVKPVLATGKG